MCLELIPPPRDIEGRGADDPGSSENLGIESPHESAQLSCRLLREGVQNGLEVITEVLRSATASGFPAPVRSEGIGDPPQRAVGRRRPVREGLSRVAGPEACPFEPADVGPARPGQPVDRRTRTAEVVPGTTDGEILPYGRRAPTRHCPFGGGSCDESTVGRADDPELCPGVAELERAGGYWPSSDGTVAVGDTERPAGRIPSGAFSLVAGGAPGRTRTCGQALRRRLLYPLSYGGRCGGLSSWCPRRACFRRCRRQG